MGTEINPSNSIEISPKKRVLFIITQSEIGGAQRFLYNLLSRLDKNRYETLVAVGADGGSDIFKLTDSLDIKTNELAHLKRSVSPINDLLAIFEIKKLIKKFKPDTLFLLSSKAGFIGSLAALNIEVLKYRNIRVIYRIGGWSFNDPRPKWEKLIWRLLEQLSAKWKDTIVINSKHDLEQAKTFKIKPREKTVLIYNGLDVYKMEFLPRNEARLKLFHGITKVDLTSDTIKVIGTIANFYPTKGLKHLVEAAEHFKNKDDVVFVIVGDGQERAELENLIKQKGLQKKVILLGQIPDAHSCLLALDIFVMPSVKEGFPWVVLEAMAAKLPIVATRVGAVPEIIEDGRNGFIVEPAHSEQIVGKIQELLNNEHLRQELGIQAHQTVLFKFPLEKMVKEVESLL